MYIAKCCLVYTLGSYYGGEMKRSRKVVITDVGGPVADATTICLDRYITFAEKLDTRIRNGRYGMKLNTP